MGALIYRLTLDTFEMPPRGDGSFSAWPKAQAKSVEWITSIEQLAAWQAQLEALKQSLAR